MPLGGRQRSRAPSLMIFGHITRLPVDEPAASFHKPSKVRRSPGRRPAKHKVEGIAELGAFQTGGDHARKRHEEPPPATQDERPSHRVASKRLLAFLRLLT